VARREEGNGRSLLASAESEADLRTEEVDTSDWEERERELLRC
jgi:hypothetical protein